MFDDIKKFYSINSENRKSITIIEMINAIDDYSFSFMIIIQKQKIMINWFSNDVSSNTFIVFLENDFTFDKIALKFLKHYIKHSDAKFNAKWKLMFMNNHESHLIIEFINLINKNHIRSFSFISHLIHFMQSLNLNISRFYKHWHNVIIKEIIAKSFVEYSLIQFLSDFIKIKNNIFKSIIIRHVFEKCDMWSVDADSCIKLMKKYNRNSLFINEFTLFLLRHDNQLDEIIKMRQVLQRWDLKIAKNTQWNDSADAQKFQNFQSKISKVIINTFVDKMKLHIYRQRRAKKLNNKTLFRKRLRASSNNLRLTKKNANQVITAKFQKKREMKKKRVDVQFMKFWRMKKNDIHVKKVIARKAKKARIKQMKKMTKNHIFIFVELLQFIFDLETEWKTTNSTWLTQKKIKNFKKKKITCENRRRRRRRRRRRNENHR